MNPTVAVLEDRVSAIRRWCRSLGSKFRSSGICFAIQNICRSGDNFISSTDLYGGTWNLSNTMANMGIGGFVDPGNPQDYENAIDENTRCIYAEPPKSKT